MLSLRISRALALLVVCLLFSRPGFAQNAVGTISGQVTIQDTSDPVHGATVMLIGTRRIATTDSAGKFEIANVPPGTYDVLVQRSSLTARQSVTVVSGRTAEVVLKMVAGVHEDITVTTSATGTATAFEAFNAVTTLDAGEIARRMGATIADVLQDEPGMAKRTFGPGTSRPIVRGFDGDRVLIMQDGVRTGDLSSQSGDHGVSIDPASLDRLEVVKGPATLLYGSNAIGGVVNAITPQDAFRAVPFSGTLGSLSLDGGTANAQTGFSGNLQHGRGPWLLHGSLTQRRTADYDTPTATIANSATRLFTTEAGAGWTGTRGFVSVGAGAERNRYGIPFAGELEGEPDAAIDLVVRRQNVRFDGGLRNLSGPFADSVRVTASFLDYQHDEVEVADGEESLGTRFNNQVFTARAEVQQKAAARLTGRLGAEFLNRDYEAIGEEALAPATTQQSIAAFLYEEMSVGRHRLQFGGRVERNQYTASAAEGDIDRAFVGASGSAGFHAELSTHVAAVANLTGASRAPALEELFNFGPHPGNLAFEIGNADLGLERTVGIDVSLRGRGQRARGEVNVFAYNISNFVFLDVTDEIEDGLRVANYVQGDSRFTGIEAAAHIDAGTRASLNAAVGYVRATLTGTNEALPRIPPMHGRFGLDVRVRSLTVTPEVVFSSPQKRVFRDETATAGWATVNVGASWQIGAGHNTQLLTVQAYNLTNQEYRLHTSFIKDLAPEMSRGARVTYTVKFF